MVFMLSKKTLGKILVVCSLTTVITLSPISCFAKEYTPTNYYKQNKTIIQKYFKVPQGKILTPAFKEGKEGFTTHDEMMNFIYNLKKQSKNMQIDIIGKSQEGRPIPLLIFSKPSYGKSENVLKLDKPVVWLQGQIHGNEPAGGEAMLALAKNLAGKLGDEVLDKITVVIVPRFNSDGSSRCERVMANGLDANRDHLKFDIEETKIIHEAFNKFKPEVVVDTHEYWACNKFDHVGVKNLMAYHDLLMSSAKNLNIPKEVRTRADSIFVESVKNDLNSRGYTFNPYYTARKAGDKIAIYEAGTDGKIGRNAYGLQPSFSFLVETRGIGIGKENFERRVMSHIIASQNVIRTTAKNSKLVKSTIDNARKNISSLDNKTEIVIESQHKHVGNTKIDAINQKNGNKVTLDALYFSSTDGIASKKRERPRAYILSPAYKDVAKRLSYSGVTVKVLSKDMEIPVEAFKVKNKKVDSNFYEGHLRNKVLVDISKKTVKFPKGSYVFSMNQPTANIIAMSLEPDTVDSFVTFSIIPVDIGHEIPIYRYMENENLYVNHCKMN